MFRFEIPEDYCLIQNQHPQDLGLEFQKTNVGIKISILKTHCVPICNKTNNLDFSTQIYSKMDLELGIQKTNVGIRINIF